MAALIRPLEDELSDLLAADFEQFEIELKLREPKPPAPPTAEQIAARAAAEQRQRAAALHQHRVRTDPNYVASMYPIAGSAPNPPPGDVASERRALAERQMLPLRPTAFLRGQSAPTDEDIRAATARAFSDAEAAGTFVPEPSAPAESNDSEPSAPAAPNVPEPSAPAPPRRGEVIDWRHPPASDDWVPPPDDEATE